MTVTRPPSRSTVQAREPEDLEQLEELGDDAIISQQTAAHAPQPRANVSEEARSVVITDHPLRRDTEPPRNAGSRRAPAPPRSSAEATLVIRDRRALDELRQNIVRRKPRAAARRRALYMWGALGLVAFLLGGVVAFLATDGIAETAPPADSAGPSGRAEAKIALPRAEPAKPIEPAHAEPTPAVRLDDLPVEAPKKR